MTNTAEPGAPEHLDVVVVGAGISGVGAGYRLQSQCPDKSYAILEARGAMGGTWDLFRYPGLRSDSDMFTLSYPFEPWRAAESIADGPSILRYIEETAAKHGIDRHIRYHTKVVAADWSTADTRWTLTVERREAGGTAQTTLTCGFLYSCAGYFDYDKGHDPGFAGLDAFSGTIAHPQFWPEDLDYGGKRVVVIGSGATAVTLAPAMAEHAAVVTMLQRTPAWIGVLRSRDKHADMIRSALPPRLAHRVIRTKNILFALGIYQLCKRRPATARRRLLDLATRLLKDEALVAEHFTPPYDPWEQRLCVAPDADFFRAVRRDKVRVVTDHIDTFVPEGVRLRSGTVLEADVVVTATGLQMRALGGVTPSVDGRPVTLAEEFVWCGALVTGLPNFALCMGYTNASWTLRADLSSRLVCKVLDYMDENDYAAVVPTAEDGMVERPLLDLAAGYVQRSIGQFPRQGDHGVWRFRQNYLIDAATTMRADLRKTLAATPRSAVRRGVHRPETELMEAEA